MCFLAMISNHLTRCLHSAERMASSFLHFRWDWVEKNTFAPPLNHGNRNFPCHSHKTYYIVLQFMQQLILPLIKLQSWHSLAGSVIGYWPREPSRNISRHTQRHGKWDSKSLTARNCFPHHLLRCAPFGNCSFPGTDRSIQWTDGWMQFLVWACSVYGSEKWLPNQCKQVELRS